MALRIRRDGRVLCAAMHPPEDGDAYVDDGLHYVLSVELRVLRPLPYGAWEFGPLGFRDLDEACDDHMVPPPKAHTTVPVPLVAPEPSPPGPPPRSPRTGR